MMFCLDDGAELLYGPAKSEPGAVATGFPSDEPQTAILHSTAVPGEAPTRAQIKTTDQTAILHTGAEAEPQSLGGLTERQSLSAHRAAKPLMAAVVAVILLVGGFFAYRYFSPTNQIESIAVMPFVNESGNADVEYLSDGMTETLINSLSQIPNLSVKARTSVFRYKNKGVELRTVASELGVQAILTGRIVQRGEQLAVNLELIDGRTENVLWGNRYERKPSDIVALQSEIAKNVSTRLRSQLSGTDVARVEKKNTADPEAFQLYLKGRYEFNKATTDGFKKAADLFKQAIAKDPNYARAYAELGMTYTVFPNWSIAPPKDSMPLAKAAALRALELDDSLPDAHLVLARYRNNFEWDRVGAESELRRAIQLDPSLPRPHVILSIILSTQKRFDEALSEAKRARELDPLSAGTGLGERLADARRFDEAIDQFKSVLSLEPDNANAYYQLGGAYFGKGLYQESISAFQKSYELDPDPVIRGSIALAQSKLGRREPAMKELEFLKTESARRYVPSVAFGYVYLALGQRDDALTWLEKDVEERTDYANYYAVDSALDELRDNPRFKTMLKRLNLPE